MKLIASLISLTLLVPCLAFAQDYDLDLDNGTIHLGVHCGAYGGAITHLSRSGEARNLINLHDRGREIQQSYYAGKPLDRLSEGQSKAWTPWPWNPIQVGDAYGNSSKVVESKKADGQIYVKTIPLLWDMKNEFGECELETWISLDQNTAHVRNRLAMHRTDDRWPAVPCQQELPAVYTIGDLTRLMTYVGDAPFTKAPLTQIVNNGPPWEHWGPKAPKPELNKPHEKWAANVDGDSWGVGVYNAKTEFFCGGFHDKPGGSAHDNSTGYISPLGMATLDKNSVYEYEYDLVLGTLDQIRAFVYNREGHADYDGDGLTYEQETRDLDTNAAGTQNPFSPANADSVGNGPEGQPDGVPDGQNDSDGDGMSNAEEFAAGYNPLDVSSCRTKNK